MDDLEDENARRQRWAASLRRTSAATRAEAERHGEEWEFFSLSIASSEAQAAQADAMERGARLNLPEVEWSE